MPVTNFSIFRDDMFFFFLFLIYSFSKLRQEIFFVAPLKCKSLKHLLTQKLTIHELYQGRQPRGIFFFGLFDQLPIAYIDFELNQSDKMSQTVTTTMQNDPNKRVHHDPHHHQKNKKKKQETPKF